MGRRIEYTGSSVNLEEIKNKTQEIRLVKNTGLGYQGISG
jgi:hypothetical protein